MGQLSIRQNEFDYFRTLCLYTLIIKEGWAKGTCNWMARRRHMDVCICYVHVHSENREREREKAIRNDWKEAG